MPENPHQKDRDRESNTPHRSRSSIPVGTAIIDAEINEYRRRRRRQAQQARESRNQMPSFATELLKFAQNWAAYGGAPESEIFVQFGMATSRFADALRQIMSTVDCDPEVSHQLRIVYPLF